MAYGNYDMDKGYHVSAAITKFRAVVYTDTEEVGPVTAKGDVIAGFAQYSVSAAEILRGKDASVRIDGITEAEVGNTTQIEVGDSVELLADGRVGKASGGTGARVVGVCVGHPTANPAVAGDRIALRLFLDGGTQ